jgi:PTS system fructose-specific IIC component
MQDIATFLDPARVLELTAPDKQGAISELMQIVESEDLLAKPGEFHELILAREAECSTGIGRGVAIPHARPDGLKDVFIVTGFSSAGIDFGASDGAPVHLVFLIGATNDHSVYLNIISRISWLVRNEPLRQQLFRADSAATLYKLLSSH